MIKIAINNDMVESAKYKAKDLGELNNSITKGHGNLAGFLGEEVVKSILGGTLSNTYEYDLITPDGTTYDIKTKRCTSTPKEFYECSVANFNTRQDCDRYAFVRIKDNKTAWYLGWLTKKEFFEKAKFHRKDEVDPSNGFKFRADCYNVAIHELNGGVQIENEFGKT